MSNRVVIASLCPWPVSITRPLFAGTKVYEIDAVEKGAPPKVLVIEDNVQYERRLSSQPAIPTTILAKEIASDFLDHTSRHGVHMTAECGPPVWICPEGEPTPEEVAANTEKFARYCNEVVEEADTLERRRQTGEPNVPRVTQRMRECARYMGYERNWLSVMKADSKRNCPYCDSLISGRVVKCPVCSEVVDKERYAEMKKPAPPAPKPELASSAR